MARTRSKPEPYLAAQLNLSSDRDKSNSGPSWTISFGTFKYGLYYYYYGGRLWVDEETLGSSELVPPPTPLET
eukprot:1263194-Amphidinium_carterae.1